MTRAPAAAGRLCGLTTNGVGGVRVCAHNGAGVCEVLVERDMSQMTFTADRDLLAEYGRAHSAEAFAELVRRYGGMVYGVAWRVTGSREDAQDVAQECFLKLAAEAGRVGGSVGGWLHTLARTRAVDAVRRRGARQRNEQRAARSEAMAMSLEEWERLSEKVDEAIAALPEELREPLIGVYLRGRTQGEMAEVMGISQGTISRRVEKAVEELRGLLAKEGVEMTPAAFGVAMVELGKEAPLPAELGAELAKIGLSGVGAATATATAAAGMAGRAAVPMVVKIGVAGVLVAAVAGGVWMGTADGAAETVNAVEVASAGPAGDVAGVRRENGRVWIEGIRPGQRDTNPYCQGAAILFQYFGRADATYTRMMGYSGVAFALQIDVSGPIREGKYDVAWWPNDFYAFGLRAEFVGQAFGRELKWVDCDQDAYRANPRKVYREAFEPAVMVAIDKGVPVLGQQGSAVLVSGYDSNTHLPILVWPSPGQPAFGPAKDATPWSIFVPGKAVEAMAQDAAELESLRWAITLWDEKAAETAKGWDASTVLTGSKAFAKWLELLQQQKEGVGLGRDAWDNNMMIHLRYNRTAAVAYLREVAGRHPAVAEELNAAADLYEEALGECNEAPFWGNTAPEKRGEGLRLYTDIVRRTMVRETEAVDRIRQAVSKWK